MITRRCVLLMVAQMVLLSFSSVDSMQVGGTLFKKSRRSWAQLRPHLMSQFFTPYEQCLFAKLQARNDSAIACDTIADNKRVHLLLDNKCLGDGNDPKATPDCNGFNNVDEQVLRWDATQGGPDSKPSTFLDVVQRLPSGTNTILFIGDSTMKHVYKEAVCSLLRHLPEDSLDDLTYYEGANGPSLEVNQIGIAAGANNNAVNEKKRGFWATRVPAFGRDVLILFRRHEGVEKDRDSVSIPREKSTIHADEAEPGTLRIEADEGEESTYILSAAEGRSMFETIWRLRGGILTVASQAFHVRPVERYEGSLYPFFDMLQFSGQRAKARTLFLEPQATHFPHTGGLYDDLDPSKRNFSVGPNGCRHDVSADAGPGNYYGSIVNKVLARHQFPNVTLLPFWEETSTRGAVHRGKNEFSLDCLHNCPNALLHEPIWEGMLKSISHQEFD